MPIAAALDRMVLAYDNGIEPSVSLLDAGHLELVSPFNVPGWNRMCLGHAGACCFHSAEWMRVLAETYGLTPACLLSKVNGEAAGVIPLFEVKSLWGARRAVGLPFTDFCEPLLAGQVNRESLWAQVVKLGQSRAWQSIEWRGGKCLSEAGSPSVSFFGHSLNLSQDAELLFAKFCPAARRAVRKAEREGVKVSISTGIEAVSEYYDMHCETRKRHGIPPQPFSFFRKMHEHVIRTGSGFTAIARRLEVPLAGGIFLRFGKRAMYKFGASNLAGRQTRSNDLVMWETIKYLAREGCAVLHLGRTSKENEGLRRFKLGLGTQEQVIDYFRFDLRKLTFTKDRDRASGWHTLLFRFTPSWLARAIGSLLYGRLA